MTRTLVVTNDFPPRQGGIQTYVSALIRRQPADSVVVFAPAWEGAASYDRSQAFPIIRHRTSLVLPTPEIRRRVGSLTREYDCDRAWFGAAAPLALLAPTLRDNGIERVMASTHGHETGWVRLPGARQVLHRLAAGVDVVTYITEFTRSILAPVLADVTELRHLPPGVDVAAFHPAIDGAPVRRRLGLDAGTPVVACVSRLVRRKGQDVLIRAWQQVRSRFPDAALLLVGGGPDLKRLQALVERVGATGVHFVGGVSSPDLPSYYAACDVFAMPCRTRRAGLDVEGLGMVYLEAAACARPVIAGSSGGAPEAVRHGETGLVVDDPRSPTAVADSILALLDDRERATAMGAAGRAWIEAVWSWDSLAARWRSLLA
ncbi:MAG: glycosyltransferase family 4 protein [Geodermatophilaceae bacterium]|nr:glycosyltransferase family 4 protein [Geodermatophilaceae bacterium]